MCSQSSKKVPACSTQTNYNKHPAKHVEKDVSLTPGTEMWLAMGCRQPAHSTIRAAEKRTQLKYKLCHNRCSPLCVCDWEVCPASCLLTSHVQELTQPVYCLCIQLNCDSRPLWRPISPSSMKNIVLPITGIHC